MASKTWTLEELTNSAEVQIERCRINALRLVSEGDKDFAKQYAGWAYGVCELWHEQTKGHHSFEDRERLISLVKAVENVAAGNS